MWLAVLIDRLATNERNRSHFIMNRKNSHRESKTLGECRVALRDLPAPYNAMLAICSDLDETEDHQNYIEIATFLNTSRETSYGPGVDLDVGNSIYFDMAPDQYSFWNATEDERQDLLALIKSGHIDCFHSFGDTADSREHAERALTYLAEQDCRLRTWIDHAVAPTNFGADIMNGHGDIAESRQYHADLTVAHGVEYVWTGRVTSVIGQGVARKLGKILNMNWPLKSLVTLGKEFLKGLLGMFPGSRYVLHDQNCVLRPTTLRDGQQVLEFLRCNPHPGGVSAGDRGDRLYEALTDEMLRTLVSRRGTSIIYTHLGKLQQSAGKFPRASVEALRNLAAHRDSGNILVASTTRILDYQNMLSSLEWRLEHVAGKVEIHLDTEGASIEGLSFDVSPAAEVALFCGGKAVENPTIQIDGSGESCSVSVPWQKREFPL